MIFRNILFVFGLIVFYSGCTNQSSIQLKQGIFELNLPENKILLELKNPIIHKFNRFVSQAYTASEGAYHIQYIRLRHNVTWNGLASGHFRYQFIQEFKGAQTIEILDHQNIKAYKYEHQGKNLYLISISNVYSNTFIVDYTGFIVSKIFEDNHHIPISLQTKQRLKKSLLDHHFENYFSAEREFDSRFRL